MQTENIEYGVGHLRASRERGCEMRRGEGREGGRGGGSERGIEGEFLKKKKKIPAIRSPPRSREEAAAHFALGSAARLCFLTVGMRRPGQDKEKPRCADTD